MGASNRQRRPPIYSVKKSCFRLCTPTQRRKKKTFERSFRWAEEKRRTSRVDCNSKKRFDHTIKKESSFLRPSDAVIMIIGGTLDGISKRLKVGPLLQYCFRILLFLLGKKVCMGRIYGKSARRGNKRRSTFRCSYSSTVLCARKTIAPLRLSGRKDTQLREGKSFLHLILILGRKDGLIKSKRVTPARNITECLEKIDAEDWTFFFPLRLVNLS